MQAQKFLHWRRYIQDGLRAWFKNNAQPLKSFSRPSLRIKRLRRIQTNRRLQQQCSASEVHKARMLLGLNPHARPKGTEALVEAVHHG